MKPLIGNFQVCLCTGSPTTTRTWLQRQANLTSSGTLQEHSRTVRHVCFQDIQDILGQESTAPCILPESTFSEISGTDPDLIRSTNSPSSYPKYQRSMSPRSKGAAAPLAKHSYIRNSAWTAGSSAAINSQKLMKEIYGKPSLQVLIV